MIDRSSEATDVQRRKVVWTRALSKPCVGTLLGLFPLLIFPLIPTCKCLFVLHTVLRVRDGIGLCPVHIPSDRNLKKDKKHMWLQIVVLFLQQLLGSLP